MIIIACSGVFLDSWRVVYLGGDNYCMLWCMVVSQRVARLVEELTVDPLAKTGNRSQELKHHEIHFLSSGRIDWGGTTDSRKSQLWSSFRLQTPSAMQR